MITETNIRNVESSEVLEYVQIFNERVPRTGFLGKLGFKKWVALDKPKIKFNALLKVDADVPKGSVWRDDFGNKWHCFKKQTLYNVDRVVDYFEVPDKIYLHSKPKL